MEFPPISGAFHTVLILFLCSAVAYADSDPPVASSLDYQLRRLNAPTPAERAAEERGSIYIYESLNADQVNEAMNENFERIQNMMFIRIHHLPATGSGPARVEDDGC